MSASSRQMVSDAGFPASGAPREKLGYALKYAMLAPTEIDWQPWRFNVTDRHIELMARNDPGLNTIDPEGRELMISCGSALVYLKLALKHFGCLGRIELFPAFDQPSLAARIHFGSGRERDELDRRLFEATTKRPVNAPGDDESPISASALSSLSLAVERERGWVEFAQSETSRQRLLEFVVDADHQLRAVVGPDELPPPAGFRGSEEAPDDSPLGGAGRRVRSFFGFMVRRNADEPPPEIPEGAPSLPSATLAVVKTKTDDKHGWLAAGHTMARVILQAQALGLSWGFFNQAVRRRYGREALRTGIGHKGFAQVILRLAATATQAGFSPPSMPISRTSFQW